MPTPQAPATDTIDFEAADADSDEGSRQALRDRLESLGHHVTHFVTTRPLAAVGIALAAGFLLGRVARR